MSPEKPKKANGRPRFNQCEVLVPVSAKVPTSTYNRLAVTAVKTGTSVSALVRELIDPSSRFSIQK